MIDLQPAERRVRNRRSLSACERCAELEAALRELVDAGDNSIHPEGGDDIAAMLRFSNADKAARELLASVPKREETK